MRSAKVPLSPSSALQTMYFCGAGRLRHRAPLDAGREAGAAAAAQARLHHFLDDGVWANRKGFRQSLAAAMRAVIFERARIDDTAARERQPRLAFEPGNVVGRSEPQRVCAVSEKGGQQPLRIGRRHRSVRNPAGRGLGLDHRFEPVEPARAGADNVDRGVAPGGGRLDTGRHLVGADRERRGIERNVKPQGHCCASARSASSRAWSSRPISRPSSMAEGATAQRPRQ